MINCARGHFALQVGAVEGVSGGEGGIETRIIAK